MFCASRDILVSYGICSLIQQNFGAAYYYVLKADLSKGYQNPKRKWGVTSQFITEIIQLKLGKKSLYILCILTLFRNNGCLIISEKMLGYPHFSFWLPINLVKIYVSP